MAALGELPSFQDWPSSPPCARISWPILHLRWMILGEPGHWPPIADATNGLIALASDVLAHQRSRVWLQSEAILGGHCMAGHKV